MSLQALGGAVVTLSADFLQDCSYVDWAGQLHAEQSFVANKQLQTQGDADGNHKNSLMLTLFNKEGGTRPWASNDRLQHVRLQYRRLGSAAWQWGLNSQLQILNAMGNESPYGT